MHTKFPGKLLEYCAFIQTVTNNNVKRFKITIPDFCPAGSRGHLGIFGELFKINKIIFRLNTEIY